MLYSWIAAYGYTIQIYCDFGGYSDIAIGLALIFGFHFQDNFKRPYGSLGFSDFWQRWHISLSTWLRDYLYIPLGGNRKGPVRTYVNLMATMLICGLWHGAQWTFVIWGGIHGLYLSIERFFFQKLDIGRNSASKLPLFHRILISTIIFHLVCVAWVFFRADSTTNAFTMLSNMFCIGKTFFITGGHHWLRAAFILLLCFFIAIWHFVNRNRTLDDLADKFPDWSLGMIAGALFILCLVLGGTNNEFIYFQF